MDGTDVGLDSMWHYSAGFFLFFLLTTNQVLDLLEKQLKTNPALPHQSHSSKLTIVNYCKTTIAFILYFYD